MNVLIKACEKSIKLEGKSMKKLKLSMLVLVVAVALLAGAGTALALPTDVNETTLTGGGTVNSTSVTINDAISLKAGNTIVIEPGTANEERVGVSAYNSGTKTVTLTTGLTKAHANGAVVRATNTPGSTYEHDAADSDNFQGGTETATTGGGAALPITSGPHGRFTTNTNGCGRCHQLHRAPTQRLIRFNVTISNNPIYDVCTYCHSFNGQSTYDVKDGMIWDTNDGKRYATNGGGFERMLVVEGKAPVATLTKASSSHRVAASGTLNGDGTYTYIRYNAPGGYVETLPSNDGHVELKCSSCHQPHGTANSRLLLTQVLSKDSSGNNLWRPTSSGGTKVIVKVTNPFADETTQYNEEIATFCGACHYDYVSSNASSKSGYYDATKYRHKMKMGPDSGLNNIASNDGTFGYNSGKMILPLASIGNDGNSGTAANTVICLTCHYAHGTFARVDGIKTYDDLSLNSTTKLNTTGSFETPKNLRLDNRGVCQNCHNRTASTVKPVLTNVLDSAQAGTAVYGDSGTLLTNTKAVSPDATTIVLRFDQYMWKKGQTTGTGIENPANYSLAGPVGAPTISSAVLSPDGRTVVLTTSGSMPAGAYTLTVSNVTDLNYNTIDTTGGNNQATFTK